MTINSLYKRKTNNNIKKEKEDPKSSETLKKTTQSWWGNISVKPNKKPVKYNSEIRNNQQSTEKYKSYYPVRATTETPVQVKEENSTVKHTEVSNVKTPGDFILQFFVIIQSILP